MKKYSTMRNINFYHGTRFVQSSENSTKTSSDSNPFNLNFSVIPWREKLQQIMVYKEQSKSITSHNLLIPLLKFCCHMLYCEAGKV